MKTLKIKKKIKNADHLMGEFLNENDFEQLIDFNCDVFSENGNLLAKFRKEVIDINDLKSCVDNIRKAIINTDSRGIASGKVIEEKTLYKSGKKENFHLFGKKKDGTLSKFKRGNLVYSSVIGYLDRSKMFPYCRKTAFTKENIEKFKKALPFIKRVDQLYKELIPDKYEYQNTYARASNQNYIIDETVFSTVTINKDFQTAVHKDSGDLQGGFGNLSCYKTQGSKGGYFVLPEYKIAFDLCSTDLLLVDVHLWHGNTPIINETKEDERISFVMYYRENTIKCLSPSNELERVKRANNKL